MSTQKIIKGTLTQYERDTIFWKGAKAFAYNVDITQNPYLPGTESFEEWNIGWEAAKYQNENVPINDSFGVIR